MFYTDFFKLSSINKYKNINNFVLYLIYLKSIAFKEEANVMNWTRLEQNAETAVSKKKTSELGQVIFS